MIPGVERRPLELHSDARGTLREIWRSSVRPFDPHQALVTDTLPGALRGMHVHFRQWDLCHAVSGRVFMALVDLRAPEIAKEEFWLTTGESLLIPPGVAHGYATVDRAVMLYLLSHESDGSDEFGFSYADPEAAIAWPVRSPTLSVRDRTAGSLQAIRKVAAARIARP